MMSSRPARRRTILWSLLVLAGLLCWFWPKKVSSESYSYYSSLLCLIAGNPQLTPAENFSTVLQKTVAQSDSDYALRKGKYDSSAADAVINHWKTLSSEQQHQARQDGNLCAQLMHSRQ